MEDNKVYPFLNAPIIYPEDDPEFLKHDEKTELDKNYEKVLAILNHSDIVWSRYGSDTTAELAARIVSVFNPE
jgi:hypothetical protein